MTLKVLVGVNQEATPAREAHSFIYIDSNNLKSLSKGFGCVLQPFCTTILTKAQAPGSSSFLFFFFSDCDSAAILSVTRCIFQF